MTMWSSFLHIVVWDVSDSRLNLYFVLHFVLLFGFVVFVVLCVDCCVILGNAVALVCWYCVYCEENITSRTEVFICVITVIAYVFNLFLVVTVVYNGDSCFCFENIQYCM
jgi:hypothetical protein